MGCHIAVKMLTGNSVPHVCQLFMSVCEYTYTYLICIANFQTFTTTSLCKCRDFAQISLSLSLTTLLLTLLHAPHVLSNKINLTWILTYIHFCRVSFHWYFHCGMRFEIYDREFPRERKYNLSHSRCSLSHSHLFIAFQIEMKCEIFSSVNEICIFNRNEPLLKTPNISIPFHSIPCHAMPSQKNRFRITKHMFKHWSQSMYKNKRFIFHIIVHHSHLWHYNSAHLTHTIHLLALYLNLMCLVWQIQEISREKKGKATVRTHAQKVNQKWQKNG